MMVRAYISVSGIVLTTSNNSLDYTASAEGQEPLASTHRRLDFALNPQATESPDDLPLSMKMKTLYSKVILECCDIDTLPTLDMMKSFSDDWLKVVDKQPMPMLSLDEYFRKRVADGGCR
jgi:hypothetical protein